MKSQARLFTNETRIRRSSDFSYVRAHGVNRAGRFCALRAARPREPGRRVAIVVSRYFSPLAVVRNRAKRVLRESCRQVLHDFPDMWLVIRPRGLIKQARTEEVAEDLCRTLKKAWARLQK